MKIRTIFLLLLGVQAGLFAQGFEIEGTAVTSGVLDGSLPFYHLLILDRTNAPNSDISGINSNSVVYKVKHGKNGYLLVLYKVSQESKTIADLPQNSVVITDLATNRKNVIKEFVNSAEFKKLISAQKIIGDLQKILDSNL